MDRIERLTNKWYEFCELMVEMFEAELDSEVRISGKVTKEDMFVYNLEGDEGKLVVTLWEDFFETSKEWDTYTAMNLHYILHGYLGETEKFTIM